MRMKLSWLENTRPDRIFKISQTTQIARAIYEKEITSHFKRLNEAIKYVHDHKEYINLLSLTETH